MMASLLQINTASTLGSGSLPSNTVANPKGELKAITTRSGHVIDGPTVTTPPTSINKEVDERVEETRISLSIPSRSHLLLMLKQKQQEKDEVQIQNFWQMFKKLHVNVTLADALILMPKYQKMLKSLLSNKEKLQELANTPLNKNCSAVILKKLPKKLGDPGKFLIPCGFSELKYKALADLGASINLMPLSMWKKLCLPELISTRMTLELANRAICTPTGITRDVFVPVGKFTFPADFVIVDYESDPRFPLILGRPFLRTTRALIDVHGEETILHDGDKRLTLNMKHNTASYSNHPHRESANLINSFNVSSEHFLVILVSNQQSGNPALSLHQESTSLEITHEIHDSEGCNWLSEILPDIDAFNNIHPYFDDDPLSSSTTYSANSLLEEFTDELALITYPPDYDDNLQFDIESYLEEIEFLLYQGKDSSLKDPSIQMDHANLDDYFVDPLPEMFTEEYASDYSSPPKFDVYLDDFLENESYANNFYDDSFNSEGEKIKESKLLMDELDLPCDSLPYSESNSFNSQDFSRVDDLSSPDNKDKVFNPRILIHEKSVTIITRVALEKKLAISYASLVFKDFEPSFCAPLFFKDVPKSRMLLLFSTENKEKVFKPGIHTSGKIHSYFLPELSHPGYHVFNINQIFISLIKIFLVQCGKNTPIMDVLLVDDLPSPDNEDKVFNPGILFHEKLVTIITRVAQEKKLAISYASLMFKDFEPPFCTPLFFKDVPKSRMLLPFSTENKDKVFKLWIHTSGKIHSCFLPELSHPGYHVFKINQIFISLMKIFLV
nr:reverse transcriptase domain-containing protein [Tanacetum cinerariifolium]